MQSLLGALLVRALLLLVGTPPRLLLLPGAGRNPAENQPQQVNGMLGGAVLFPLKLPSRNPVARIEWFFRTGSDTEFRIAELRGGKLQQNITSGKFSKRLEMADETTLRIRALQKEDNGVLKAIILFATHKFHEQTFLLSVFEPLPDPQIRHQVTSRTAEACNVTLQCLAPERGRFNISWKRGTLLPVLGEDSGRYRLSPNGTELHLSWRPNSSDSTVTCLLSNPIDQKNVSLDLLSICPSEGHSWVMWLLLAAVLIFILAVAGLGIYLWKKRASQADYSSSVPDKKGFPGFQYVEMQMKRSPP